MCTLSLNSDTKLRILQFIVLGKPLPEGTREFMTEFWQSMDWPVRSEETEGSWPAHLLHLLPRQQGAQWQIILHRPWWSGTLRMPGQEDYLCSWWEGLRRTAWTRSLELLVSARWRISTQAQHQPLNCFLGWRPISLSSLFSILNSTKESCPVI